MALIRQSLPLFTRTIRVVQITKQVREIKRWVAPTLIELKYREEKQGGKVVNPRNTFLEWNFESEIYAFGKRLNEDFDADLLQEAFTDRSYVIKEEMKQKELDIDIKMKDNLELAEEGEKFMKEYIQLYLEAVLPRFPLEGISGIRHHLTSESTLADISAHLGTKDIILAAEYPVDNTKLSTAFKAIVGALIKSSGEERAAHFVRDFVITTLQGKDVNEFWHIEDPWALLTELISNGGTTVEPRLIGEAATHTVLACYRVGLYIDRKMVSAGFGETVATAKEMAAREALKRIFGTQDHMKPINFKLEGIPKPTSQTRYQLTSN